MSTPRTLPSLSLIPVLEELLAKSETTILKSLIGILVLSHFWYIVSFVFFTLAQTRQNQSQTNKTQKTNEKKKKGEGANNNLNWWYNLIPCAFCLKKKKKKKGGKTHKIQNRVVYFWLLSGRNVSRLNYKASFPISHRTALFLVVGILEGLRQLLSSNFSHYSQFLKTHSVHSRSSLLQ